MHNQVENKLFKILNYKCNLSKKNKFRERECSSILHVAYSIKLQEPYIKLKHIELATIMLMIMLIIIMIMMIIIIKKTKMVLIVIIAYLPFCKRMQLLRFC